MTFPLIGVVAVLWIGVLMFQKFRLQTRLDDSNWWIINYNDITIIREPSVRAIRLNNKKSWNMSVIIFHSLVWLLAYLYPVSFPYFIQGNPGISHSSTGSHTGSSCQSTFSSHSYDLKDKTGREHIYTTIGLYQVKHSFSEDK